MPNLLQQRLLQQNPYLPGGNPLGGAITAPNLSGQGRLAPAPIAPPRMPSPVQPLPQTQAPQGQGQGPGWLSGILNKPGMGNALMAVGMNMMAQADQPGNVLGALGRSLPAGMQAMQQAGEQEKMKGLLAKLSPQQRELIASLPLGAQQQAIFEMATRQPAAPEPYTLTPGAQRYDASGNLVAENPTASSTGTDDIDEYEYAKSEGYTGTFAEWMAANRGGQTIEVKLPGEKGFSDAMDTEWTAQRQSSANALRALDALDAMEQLFDAGLETGGWESLTMPARQVLSDFGLTSETLGQQEAFTALSSNLSLALKDPNMTGQMSDRDVAFLKEQVPKLGSSELGNKLIIEIIRRAQTRQLDMLDEMARYQAEGDGSLRGWLQAKRAYAEANPMYNDLWAEVSKASNEYIR